MGWITGGGGVGSGPSFMEGGGAIEICTTTRVDPWGWGWGRGRHNTHDDPQ